MSQRCATVHREAHASASPRLYLQAALFRAQMEREEKKPVLAEPIIADSALYLTQEAHERTAI